MLIQRRYEYTERNDTRPTSPRDIMVCQCFYHREYHAVKQEV